LLRNFSLFTFLKRYDLLLFSLELRSKIIYNTASSTLGREDFIIIKTISIDNVFHFLALSSSYNQRIPCRRLTKKASRSIHNFSTNLCMYI